MAHLPERSDINTLCVCVKMLRSLGKSVCITETGGERMFQLKSNITYPKERFVLNVQVNVWIFNIAVMTIINRSFDDGKSL